MKETKKMKELIQKAKLHDKQAFTELMQLCMQDLYKTAIAILMNEEDAADAIQDTLLSCWEKLSTLKKEQYFKTWLTRILINHCYRIRRKNRQELQLTCETVQEECIREPSDFKELLSVLDEKYRVPMYLYYGQEYRIAEIAKLLRMPQSTIQTRLQRGREQLADHYNKAKEDETHGTME